MLTMAGSSGGAAGRAVTLRSLIMAPWKTINLYVCVDGGITTPPAGTRSSVPNDRTVWVREREM